MKLSNKVAIVTGASRGIGKAIAQLLALEGASIAVASRSEQEDPRLPGTIHQTAKEIQAMGGNALAIRCDIREEAEVSNMVEQVRGALGPIDILVNNAAASFPASIIDLPLKRWDIIMDVNLRGYYLAVKAVLPDMLERKSGNILNLTSKSGEMVGRAYNGGSSLAYGVSKAAIDKFTLGLAAELAEHNIAVNALKPQTAVATEGTVTFFQGKIPSDWVGPENMAQAALYLVQQTPASLTGWIGFDEHLCEETQAWKPPTSTPKHTS